MSLTERLAKVVDSGSVGEAEAAGLDAAIGARQLELVGQGLFGPETGRAAPGALAEARRFFELATSFYYLVRDFAKAEAHFAVLSFFYEGLRAALPASELEAKVTTLRLVQLYADGDAAEFHALLAAAPAALRASADFRHLDEFVYFAEIGSFRSALAAIERISLIHKALLARMEDALREE